MGNIGMGRKTIPAVAVALFIALAVFAVHAAETLTILHLNDFHGRAFPYIDKAIDSDKPVGGAAYLAETIKRERKKNPRGVILLSAGDMFQGTPVSNLYNGRPVLDFMNFVRFDAMTLGNHEFDWGRETLGGIIRDARFPIVSANIVDRTGQTMTGVKPYVILERKGFKVAVIGLTTPQTVHMANAKSLKGLTFEQPEAILPGLIREVKAKGAHLVILLTHLGFDMDKQLATTVNGIDLIVGGHSHTAVTERVTVGKTLIVQAGYNGVYLGVVELIVDEKAGVILGTTTKGTLKIVSAGPNDRFDRDVERMAAAYGDRIKARFQEVVGETRMDLVRRTDGESNIGNIIADAMCASAGAEIGIQNNGGIRADIPRGKITMEQVYTVLPFDDKLVAMDLKGADLLNLFEMSSGLGKGMLQVSGVKIVYDPKMPAGKRLVEARVRGGLLDASKTYRVVTNDFLAAGGDRFTSFGNGRHLVYGKELRDAFLEYVRRHSPLSPRLEGRISARDE
jgi:5'-nucleotidase / UDP-sugar diphosphatase